MNAEDRQAIEGIKVSFGIICEQAYEMAMDKVMDEFGSIEDGDAQDLFEEWVTLIIAKRCKVNYDTAKEIWNRYGGF